MDGESNTKKRKKKYILVISPEGEETQNLK
jgi:hypothetical protein